MKDNIHCYQDLFEALLHCKSGSEEEFQTYKKMVELIECETEISEIEDDLSTDFPFSDDRIIYDIPCILDDYAAPFYNLACLYMSRGEYEKAIELFQKALPLYRTLEINNKDYTYQRYNAMQKLVECLCNIGNNELALYYKFELKYLKRYVIDLPKLHRIKQLLLDLKERNITLDSTNRPFIGYGNPNADILIVGKECTHNMGDEDYKKFYEPNYNHWYETVFCGHECSYRSGVEPYTFEAGNFHPINPYYKLINKKQSKNKEIGRPGPTHYYYQRLVEKIRNYKSEIIDFFDDCFITEMCEICRPNDKNLTKEQHEEIESNIRKRLDWMRKTNFFNQFKVVILACGPYAEAIKNDEVLRKDLFGEAFIVYCNQLSRWDKRLDDKIPEIRRNLYDFNILEC